MDPRFIYAGPSWAWCSFDDDSKKIKHTSLNQEWNIPCINLSEQGSTFLQIAKRVKENKNFGLPVVWVYHEPILDLVEITGLSFEEFLKRSDWAEIREECNQHCLNILSKLDVPVFLIGAHSDIVNCNHKNITIGNPSWQKFIAREAGLKVDNSTVYVDMEDGGNFQFDNCWGAEIIHTKMHQHPEIQPYTGLVDSIWDIFFFWKELEKADLFWVAHPNKRSTELFAKHTLPNLNIFLEETQ